MRTWWRADDLTASALLRLQAPHSSYPLTDRQKKGEDCDDTYTKALHTSASRPLHSDTSGGDGTSDAFAVRTARRYAWRPDARIVHAARLGGQTHPPPGDVDRNGGSRGVWCAGNVGRRAGPRLEEDHQRDAREGCGYMFSPLWHVGRSSHVSMTNGASPVAPSIDPHYWRDSTASIATPHGWQKPSPHRTLNIAAIPGMVEDYRQAARKGENDHARRSETRQQVSRHCAAEPRQRDSNTVKPGSRIPDRAGIFSRLLLTERSSSVDELRRAPSTGIDCQLLQAGHSLS